MSGWPNPEKPGYPDDPETDGWHWLANGKDVPWPLFWSAEKCSWSNSQSIPVSVIMHAKYLGPALMPAEVEELVQTIGRAAGLALNTILDAIQSEGETRH
jgi:hypothetical protein